MKIVLQMLKPAMIGFMAMSLLCGVAYTAVVTGFAQLLFSPSANGSIIAVRGADGSVRSCGSALIGQEFSSPQYLIGRPLGTTNLSPVGERQTVLVRERMAHWHALDPSNTADIPVDLVTASGSGVDPTITPEAAEYQIRRIALARGMRESDVRAAIAVHTRGRFLGIFGEPAVNVLGVNLALDGLE